MLQQWVPAGVPADVSVATVAPRVADEDAVVDISALESIRSFPGGERILADAVRMLIDAMPGQLTTMRLCVKGGETDELLRLAHSLKSSTGMLGLLKVSNAMRLIEHGSGSLSVPELLVVGTAVGTRTVGVGVGSGPSPQAVKRAETERAPRARRRVKRCSMVYRLPNGGNRR